MPSAWLLDNQQFSDFTFTPLAGFGPGTYALIVAGSVSGNLVSNSGTVGGYAATLAVTNNEPGAQRRAGAVDRDAALRAAFWLVPGRRGGGEQEKFRLLKGESPCFKRRSGEVFWRLWRRL